VTTTTEHAADIDLGRDRAITLRLDRSAGGIEFAKDDPDLIVGIPVVKPGTFNGTFVVEETDLLAWAERFNQLRGVFRPPMREDHSWSVSQVLGRYVDLRVEDRLDETVGVEVPMLVGDIRLVGTAQERADTRERILSGKYDERSSEFYPYRTNAGVEYPSVFMGAAFVDIPAVEGLGAITLRRDTLTNDRTTDQGATVPETDEQDEQQPTAPLDTPTPTDPVTSEPTTPPATTEEHAGHPAEVDAPDDDAPELGDDPTADDPETHTGAPAADQPAGDLRAALRAAGVADEVLLRRVEREVEERTTRRVELAHRMTTFTDKGVIPMKLRGQVEALLGHDDKSVRDGVAALLDAARPPVALRDTRGTQTSEAPGGARDGHIALTMTAEEVNAVFEAATPDQQSTYLRAELKTWQDARAAQQ
jgi:hypothetical protein